MYNTDVTVSPFANRVYSALKLVPKGKVTTYGELARIIGTKAYRAVGQVLHRNPFAPAVPCHRVICSNGDIGGFAWGQAKKTQMLKSEGVPVQKGKVVQLSEYLFRFPGTSSR